MPGWKVQIIEGTQPLVQSQQSGNPLWYLVYAVFAFVSPWFWALGLVLWPILAQLLPRYTDEEGNEHRRWRAAAWLAFISSYIVAYVMVAIGFTMLPLMLKLLPFL